MARKEKTVYEITDDLTGESIPEDEAENIELSYGGNTYRLDLSKDNAAKLDELLRPYIDAVRPVRAGSAKRGSTGRTGVSLTEIREWAKANGHNVSDRGRISADVLSAYRQANK